MSFVTQRMNPSKRTIFAVIGCLIALPSQAEAYKCQLPDGGTEISNMPCAKGSSTLKTIQADPVSEQNRRDAERKVEQMRKDAEKLEAARLAEQPAKRETPAKEQPVTQRTDDVVQECLRNLERMSVDVARRAELEAGCRSRGMTGEPVYVPVPYYGGPGYAKPLPPRPPAITPPPQRPPTTRPEPEPLPQPINPPVNKGSAIFAPPQTFQGR